MVGRLADDVAGVHMILIDAKDDIARLNSHIEIAFSRNGFRQKDDIFLIVDPGFQEVTMARIEHSEIAHSRHYEKEFVRFVIHDHVEKYIHTFSPIQKTEEAHHGPSTFVCRDFLHQLRRYIGNLSRCCFRIDDQLLARLFRKIICVAFADPEK